MNIRNFAFVLFVVTMLFAHDVFALAHVPVNNSSKLQPIPAYVSPNVSGNVDATLAPSYENPASTNQPDQAGSSNTNRSATPSQSQSQSPSTDQNPTGTLNFVWIIAGGVLIILILVISFFVLKM